MAFTPTAGYLVTADDSPFSLDVRWKRDEAFELTFYDPDEQRQIADLTGLSVEAVVRERPMSSPSLASKTLALDADPKTGKATLTFLDSDFATGVSFDLGQRFLVLWMDLVVISGSLVRAVWDGAGNASFPLRLHQSLRGVPS